MRITPLNYNIALLSQYYELNTSLVNNNAYASIDELTDKNACAASNLLLADGTYTAEPLSTKDLESLLYTLINSDSRFAVLLLLNRSELLSLLFLLEKDKLLLGLFLFSSPKLLELVLSLPKDLLIKALLLNMDQRTLLSMMPQKELLRILRCDKISESMIVKSIENLRTSYLIQMLEAILGESVSSSTKHADVLRKLSKFNKRQLIEGLFALPRGTILRMTGDFTEKDPSLLMEISREALSNPFQSFSKSSLVLSLSVLDNSQLINIIGLLPKELIAKVACMIEPDDLLRALTNHFPQFLANLVC